MTTIPTRKNFPKDFVIGAATAAYQIEGHSFGGAGKTHWDTFAQSGGNVVNKENGAIACDHYHRYEEDFDLMRGFDAYRFSTSWARVMPDGTGQINKQGLDYYDRLVDAMLVRELDPFLTLYHWELPEALAAKGGWTNPEIAAWFCDYVDVITRKLGDRVSTVATFNEPWCITYLSHFLGHHAPGKRDLTATAQSVHNVLRSHAAAMGLLRERGQDNLGIVLNFEALKPFSDSKADQQATHNYDAIMNRLFVQPLHSGTYPDFILNAFEPHFPTNWQDDMPAISQPLDWLGVNYYTQQTIAHAPDDAWPSVAHNETDLAKTQMGWDIYPKGISEILVWLTSEFGADLPLYVTENGMAWPDVVIDEQVKDPERCAYIAQHLQQIEHAINQGSNVKGFFYWSLMDNFEWAFGYEKRFGMVHVDFDTQKRTPKDSYYHLKKAFT